MPPGTPPQGRSTTVAKIRKASFLLRGPCPQPKMYTAVLQILAAPGVRAPDLPRASRVL